jgi:Protein of unknown function (DUF3352)
MFRYRPILLTHFALLGLCIPSLCRAQDTTAADELLRYVPKETSLCFVLNDLRGQVARWDKSPWMQLLKKSPLAQAFVDTPEFKNLLKLQVDLKKNLDIDWPTLRDEVLGDAVVFAYQPVRPGQPSDEQGVLLIRSHQAQVLAKLLDNLNRAQKSSGELKTLETKEYKGMTYFRRQELKESHNYFLEGTFLAYTGKEELLKQILDQKKQGDSMAPAPALHLKKAAAAPALASLWINPRALDAELLQKAAGLTGPEAVWFKAFQSQWQALDGIVVTFAAQDSLELKLTVLARDNDKPASARPWFTEPPQTSEIWKRFPDNAIFSMAGRVDVATLADSILSLSPPDVRQQMQKFLQPLTTMAGLDLNKDVAPYIGPDWGLCLMPAADPQKMPMALAALAVQPGKKTFGVDQALYQGIQFLAGFSLLDFNRRHPNDPMALRTLQQDKVEVKYLAHATAFPSGVQPALALKDGYLLLATNPEAILKFRETTPPRIKAGEVPLVRISSKELAKVLREHHSAFVEHMAAQNTISKVAAAQELDKAVSMLDLLGPIEITHTGSPGQMSVILRIHPPL